MPDPDPQIIPRPLRCFGTEPFWSIDLRKDQEDLLIQPDGTEWLGDLVLQEATSFGFVGQFVTGSSYDVRLMTVTGQSCSDGMSDRSFRWEVILTTRTTSETSVRSGCCTFDGN